MGALEEFKGYLVREEKSKATINKYIHDVEKFLNFLEDKEISKEQVIRYKENLITLYKANSVNSMLAALNQFLHWLELPQFCVKQLKIQHQIFRPEEKELTKAEYIRLVKAARAHGNTRLSMIIETICGTGIRISELKYITVDAIRHGSVEVFCKGKNRIVMLSKELRKKLLLYIQKHDIKKGSVFVTKSGNAIDRSNIWRGMKELHSEANVSEQKIFPHNLRHLFARTFYEVQKDIAKLADILGHSSIDTTRIYIISTGKEHQRQLDAMGLVV